ncbi:YjcZ family sporulation protein [Bacillus alkalicola]|uniref:YjcZ family sporulation protein n=1 Tax=Evansella alkalicola TaxID=745819 RepID=A0ABS6JRJ8_9BACI|nr:YjcZ family sporulation protein [Bacillus alkalicola]MBU9721193.1 YjcZ family sporulation protein [Bacillus alkalicola]
MYTYIQYISLYEGEIKSISFTMEGGAVSMIFLITLVLFILLVIVGAAFFSNRPY